MNFINLTPHDLNIAGRVIPASGDVARVSTSQNPAGDIDGIPTVKNVMGAVQGIPAPKTDTIYIVSGFVFSASDRKDIAQPDTSPAGAIRNDSGQIVGVKQLIVK